MAKRPGRANNDDLYEAIISMESVEECRNFFEDLCTMAELSAMEQRFEVAVQLHQEKVYTDILAETGASSATISRVNRSLRYGAGGYHAVFARAPEKYNAPEKREK